MSRNNIKYSFIKNQPIGEDLFSNKSQENIATIISSKIINESDFKIIGIDGEWGSGKSNLVKLIEKKLENTHKFFVYDVWGHQEDEQRKSILIELTEFVKRDLVNNKKSWDNKLKILLSKSKETKTINIPYLSIGIIFTLFSLVYVPTINTLKGLKPNFLELVPWFWKIIIVAFPIIILFLIYLRNLVKNWYYKNGFWKSFCIALGESSQIYSNKQKEETKIETISESEPSVREFQNWMQEINDDLKKQIVIVFDNFDRLPKKHILSIWSSIHIFFAEKSYKNIKVIIPFDREHIQNAFKDLNKEEKGDRKEYKSFGEDYVNKTFDIVFRVTKPIMSDWKKFFEEQWKKAFFEYNEEEMKLVIQVYEFLNRRITPREIISFINEVLTIKLLDEEYKERYIAIFILKKDDILADPLKAVSNYKELLGGLYYIYSNDKEYAKQLTAIIYHIEVGKALELIYTQELRDSMLKNDVQRFNEICNSDFVDSIFYSTMVDIDSFENPILTLDSLDKDTNLSKSFINQTWKLFYDKVVNLELKNDEIKINDWQISLIKNISDDRYLQKILDNNFKLINDTNIEQFIILIDDLIEKLSEQRVLENLTRKNISGANYIKLIEYAGESYEKYNFTVDYKLLDKYLSELDIEEILELTNTEYLPKNYDFKGYREKLKTSLKTFVNPNNIQSANDTLIKIKEISQKSGALKDLLSDNEIYNLWYNNSSSKLPIINELIAMRVARGITYNSSYTSYFNTVLKTEDSEKADAIANSILNYINYGDLLLLSEYFRNNALFRQIILQMFEMDDSDKKANVINLIDRYSDIKNALKIEDDTLLKELNKWKIEKYKLDIYNLDDEFLCDCFENKELRVSQTVISVFNEEFSNFDEDGYETVFDSNGDDVHFKFFEYLELSSLTQQSLDVFERKFIELLEQGSLIGEQWWKILEIYNSNNSSISVVNLFKNIFDRIINSKIELSVELANKFLPYFIDYDILKNKEDIFRKVLRNEFLSNSNFVQCLLSNSEHIKELYKNAKTEDKDGFRNLINEQRDNNSEINKLAKAMDIRKTKGKEN
ncbi:MAG: P-loop NTPase fold protein [Capnocytophaga sp.]|nr:P-loop NTPase fold protein [Capnocytophaga sp.]